MFNYDRDKEKDIKELVSKILIQIKEYLMGFDQYEVTIGIGTKTCDFEEIRFSILESYKAVCNRMCHGTGRLIYAETFSEDMDIQLKKRFEKMRILYIPVLMRILPKVLNQVFVSCSGYRKLWKI